MIDWLFGWLAGMKEGWEIGQLQFALFGYLWFWKIVVAALFVLASVPLAVKYWWYRRLRTSGVDPRHLVSLRSWRLDLAWVAVMVCIGVVAFFTLLMPLWQRTKWIDERGGIKVVVCMDGSASALAPITKASTVSRWEFMRAAVHRVFAKLPHDRKGFCVFAASVVSQSSVTTTDYHRILKPELDDISEWFLAEVGQGTNFGAALKGCFRLLSYDATNGVCIILSDGEQQGEVEKLEQELADAVHHVRAGMYEKQLSIAFYIVPVGDPREAAKIPKRDFQGNIIGSVCCQRDGRSYIETKPDYGFLERMALIMKGKFVRLERGDELMEALEETIERERPILRREKRIVRDDLSWIGFLALMGGAIFLIVFWQ